VLRVFALEICESAKKQQDGQVLPAADPRRSKYYKRMGAIQVKSGEGVELQMDYIIYFWEERSKYSTRNHLPKT
jgi:hypothetical protein